VSPLTAADPVDFQKEIRPVLSEYCFQCHGPDEHHRKAGLRLDVPEGIAALLDSGARAVEPGKPADSELIRRVTHADPDERMPPRKTGKQLTDKQVDALRRWIASGAEWQTHWAFQPIRRVDPPGVKDAAEVRNDIDRFIQAELERRAIRPSPPADRHTLIRRVSLDLLGLQPTVAEVRAFVGDSSPGAYEKLVDRLLASPHYGERWGRHWLDQARYADSDGYSIDSPRTMWPWRDWVIGALNDDMPFDRFTLEQIAGDLLPDRDQPRLIATGFHRNTLINREGGTDPEQFRVEAVVDRVNTTGAVWLGLTLGCAQCHTHKYDPISLREYYQFFAFFNHGSDVNSAGALVKLPSPEQTQAMKQLEAEIAAARKQLAEHDRASAERRAAWETTAAADPKTPGALRTALKPAPAQRDAKQKAAVESAWRKFDEQGAKLAAALAALDKKKRDLDARIPATMVMKDLDQPRETRIHLRGDFLNKGEPVAPAVPAILPPMRSENPTRLDLARWLVDPANPLTPRVTVNRVWMRHFGRGLVETDSDFGTQGTPPSHPALLDWLASRFIADGWSLKKLHRLIVTSAAYRRSSSARPDLAEIDPLNHLLARQNRLRVEAELVRDQLLAASGKLSPRIGGPSVHPPQPEGVYAFTQVKKVWKTSEGDDRFRRTMYTFFYRSAPHPLLTTFDTPDFAAACTRRLRSNTPLQALTVANDPGLFELHRALADRVIAEAGDEESRLDRAFALCLVRPPAPAERARLMEYFRRQLAQFTADPSAAQKMLDEPADAPAPDAPLRAAWTAVARLLVNLDEFITRD
jgi:mono/diheme cytochrome c family protein